MLNANRFDKYAWGVFEFDYVVDFYRSPVAKVETEDVETNIGGNIGEASRQENGLI